MPICNAKPAGNQGFISGQPVGRTEYFEEKAPAIFQAAAILI